jgi:hypothetical protein
MQPTVSTERKVTASVVVPGEGKSKLASTIKQLLAYDCHVQLIEQEVAKSASKRAP